MDWIAHLCFQFTNFVFSSPPIPDPEKKENRARKQWSVVEWSRESSSYPHSPPLSMQERPGHTKLPADPDSFVCPVLNSWCSRLRWTHIQETLNSPMMRGYSMGSVSCIRHRSDTPRIPVLAVLWFFWYVSNWIRASDTYELNWIRPASKQK